MKQHDTHRDIGWLLFGLFAILLILWLTRKKLAAEVTHRITFTNPKTGETTEVQPASTAMAPGWLELLLPGESIDAQGRLCAADGTCYAGNPIDVLRLRIPQPDLGVGK